VCYFERFKRTTVRVFSVGLWSNASFDKRFAPPETKFNIDKLQSG